MGGDERWRQSITFDRETELSFWQQLKDGLDITSWVCDPKAPWQKGGAENMNRRIRRYLPLEQDPMALTQEILVSHCAVLNSTPRKCLGFRTPQEGFNEHLLAE